MIRGTTPSGFAFEVNENLLTDFRFVEALADMESEDAGAVARGSVAAVDLIFGRQGKKALYAHVTAADGTIPTERVMEELTEILKFAGEQERGIKN